MLQWVEWADVSGLTNGAVLPSTSGANFHIGTYETTSVYLNPLTADVTDSVWLQNTLSVSTFPDPKADLPGSIGDVIYHPRYDGPFM